MLVRLCRICKSKDLKKIFSLGKQPIANNLLDKPGKVRVYPLELLQCQHCSLIQLSYVVPKEKLYDNYLYIPSVSKTHLKHFEELSANLIKDLQLKKGDVVVDIGSSDGSLLKCFEDKGMSVVGVEPARNIQSTVLRYSNYFSEELAREIVAAAGKAKLVTATNSFAHIDDLYEYLRALDILLASDGVFFAQFPDVRNLLKENQFDTIYHEHLSYFTYEPLHHLFANSPFELYKIDQSKIHGGSMRIYVRRREKLLQPFIENVIEIKKELYGYILGQKMAGKKIVAFGAAAKGMVLLNYCGLDSKLIDYIADGTPYKQGKYAPGTNIPIVPEEVLLEGKTFREIIDRNFSKPDVVLILAWNFKEEIMAKLKGRGYTFVIPIPEVKICKK